MRRALLCLVAIGMLGCPGRRSPDAHSRTAPPSPRAGSGLSVVLITIDTLRADHLGAYGYERATSPHLDALAARGVLFEQAYTFWPKTRPSFTAMMTGLYPSLSGYDQRHRALHDFNPTLANSLQQAGYRTAAIVDNPNVAANLGFGKGFDSFDETWTHPDLQDEVARTRAITTGAERFLAGLRPDEAFFLWLHYVSPHAPYTPPAPYDHAFADERAQRGPRLKVVRGFNGGISQRLHEPGHDALGYYVARYDGEIAFTDAEVGKVLAALDATGRGATTVVMVTSDHGESLGEHDYFFDHGADLFDPCLRIPMIVAAPGGKHGVRTNALASTLDVVPTLLDAAKVRYPPDLSGMSQWPVVQGQPSAPRERLYAENDRGFNGTLDARFKLVVEPAGDGGRMLPAKLYDRRRDPGELRDVASREPAELKRDQAALSAYVAARSSEWVRTRPRLGDAQTGTEPTSGVECERLLALGYVESCQP